MMMVVKIYGEDGGKRKIIAKEKFYGGERKTTLLTRLQVGLKRIFVL